MSLFEAVRNNKNLIYVDDGDHGQEYPFNELPLFELPENDHKQLAFLYLDNSIAAITVFWSFMKSNHAVALLSPNLQENFKSELERLYNPFYIYDPARSNVENYHADILNGASIFVNKNKKKSKSLINEEIKLLLNTSGTTGSPKFVKLSGKNLLANAHSIVDYLPVKEDDVTPLNLPIYYSYGLSVLTTNSLKGGKIVCSNIDVLNRIFWQKMSAYGYTSIAGVPFVYEMLERIGFRKKSYSSLRYLSLAGGKLDKHILEKFAGYAQENNISFYAMYGQTEATARMSYVPPEFLINKLGSIGIPIKDGHFVIDDGNGELCYHGPNVFGGYVSQPSDLETYNQPALLHTGDLASVDNDGYYYITGRLKRIVKLFGIRINLDEIETIIAARFSNAIKCVGINDKILLILLTNNSVDRNELSVYLSDMTKLHPSVIKVDFIDEYPLSQNGKVDYNKIVELYGTN